MNQAAKVILSSNQPIRIVNGKPYNIVQNAGWKVIVGNVYMADGNLVVVREFSDFKVGGALFAITNCPIAPVDQRMSVVAMRCGTIVSGNIPIQLWDCGTPYIPPAPTAEQARIAQKNAEAIAERQRLKVATTLTNAVNWLGTQATNGEASAQYSLALHYLNGQGCATNRELAIYWLTKSEAQGNEESAAKLKELQHLDK